MPLLLLHIHERVLYYCGEFNLLWCVCSSKSSIQPIIEHTVTRSKRVIGASISSFNNTYIHISLSHRTQTPHFWFFGKLKILFRKNFSTHPPSTTTWRKLYQFSFHFLVLLLYFIVPATPSGGSVLGSFFLASLYCFLLCRFTFSRFGAF